MNLRRSVSAIAVGAACLAAPAAHAVIFTIAGNTTGKPTFNRLQEDLTPSAVGTAVRYDVLPFTVSIGGNYTFATTGLFDTFVLLYQGAFNPASPILNVVEANDDLAPGFFNFSGFGYTLSPGIVYNYITTGFTNTDFGAYSTTIGGPGVITAVPEPQTFALMALGLGGLLLRRRQTRAAND